MEFAIQTSGVYEDVLAAARFCEDRGLPAIALPDHYLMSLDEEGAKTAPAPDALTQLAGLARDTRDLQLVVLVSPITFRHPAVLVKAAITIDRMSGGRFTLGLGTGWMDREHQVFGFHYPPMTERYEMLEEALAYAHAMLSDDSIGFDGAHYALEAFPIAPRPVGRVKLLVGGVGAAKTPRLAGTYADEFNVYPGPDLEERIERARAAAEAAGRDPDSLALSSAGTVVAAASEAELEHRLDLLAEERSTTRDELAVMLARRGTPIGTYPELQEKFAQLESLGIERFYLQVAYDPGETPDLIEAITAPNR